MSLVRKTFTLKRVTNIAVALAVMAMLIMLVVSVKTLNNTDAASRTDQLSACRAEYRTDIDDATASRADANDALSVLNAQIFAAAVNRDPAVIDLIGRAELASRAVEAAARAAKVANDAYADAVTMSRTDPDGFLETCKRIGGGSTTTTTTTTTVPPASTAEPESSTSTAASTTSPLRRSTTTTARTTVRPSGTSTTTEPAPVLPGPSAPPAPSVDRPLLEQAIAELCVITPAEPLCEVHT